MDSELMTNCLRNAAFTEKYLILRLAVSRKGCDNMAKNIELPRMGGPKVGGAAQVQQHRESKRPKRHSDAPYKSVYAL